MRPGPLATAVALTVLIVGAAPVAGVARSWLQSALGPRFAVLLLGTLACTVAAVLATAMYRRGRLSPARWARLVAALAVAAVWVGATGSADPAIRAVELVHFVEYGVITWAFVRVWQGRAGAWAYLPAGLAAFLAGIAEEAYQWWLPARVGELRDVWLNGVAIGCALLFSSGLVTPAPHRTPSVSSGPVVPVLARMVALVVCGLAAFVHVVHLGVRISDGPTTFVSRFTPAALAGAARDRAARWAVTPPLVRPARLSREDQYTTEGVQHVQARNTAWTNGDAVTAWHENRILEGAFAPVLDTPSYLSRSGHRWSPAQRADAEARAGAAILEPFESAAFPYPLYVWPPAAVWGVALTAALACLWWSARGAA